MLFEYLLLSGLMFAGLRGRETDEQETQDDSSPENSYHDWAPDQCGDSYYGDFSNYDTGHSSGETQTHLSDFE